MKTEYRVQISRGSHHPTTLGNYTTRPQAYAEFRKYHDSHSGGIVREDSQGEACALCGPDFLDLAIYQVIQ